MYTSCIFCSARLGRNQMLTAFSVGRRVAFDAWRGRLWVVCPRCQRWNLAPIEERWEAVEEAERQFREARTRVQAENIGLARLPDGTKLVRVGEALAGELAAWRYGDRLVRRRREYGYWMGAAAVGGAALLAGAPVLAAAGVPFFVITGGLQLSAGVYQHRLGRRVVLRVPAGSSPTGAPLVVRRRQMTGARVAADTSGLVVHVPTHDVAPRRFGAPAPAETFELTGERAERLVARTLVDFNERGGSRTQVQDALTLLEQAGSARAFLGTVGHGGAVHLRRERRNAPPPITPRMVLASFRGAVIPVQKYRSPFFSDAPALSRVQALALEMSLHEDAERRALEGELAELRAAWREAEEIARIADALPDDPPQLPDSR